MKLTVEVEGQEYVVEIEMREGKRVFMVNGRDLDADAVEVEPGVYSILSSGRSFEVKIEETAVETRAHIIGRPQSYRVAVRDPRRRRAAAALAAEGRQEIASPMPGKVIRILVQEKQTVAAGQGLVVVEAMKMQNEIKSPKPGVVVKVSTREGSTVNAGETLVVIE